MKIELDVDPKDLAKSMKEILDTLPPEKRAEIARSTMEAWLREPYDAERKVKEREVVEKLMAKDSYGRKETEQEIRSGYAFRQEMGGWKSTKEVMVETVTRETIAAYKAEVSKVVETDPKIQAMKDEVVQIIRETFPKAVHDAMVQWMASSMQTMFETTMGIRQSAEDASKMQQNVFSRLSEVEGRLAVRG